MKGTIALDIDGTIIHDPFSRVLTTPVHNYLVQLAKEGWRFIFITGRCYSAAYPILEALPFKYYLALQNGTVILEMPSKKILAKKYLERSILSQMELLNNDEMSDYIIYTGMENQDTIYYRPKQFSPRWLQYVEERFRSFKEIRIPVDSFAELNLNEFPSIKCFGSYEVANKLAENIEKHLSLHVPVIKDPFDSNYYVVQATHPKISKGQALRDLITLAGKFGKVIAAGDDLNDIPMLEAADIKIAMSGSPQKLLHMADIIAPGADVEGIIDGLEQALRI